MWESSHLIKVISDIQLLIFLLTVYQQLFEFSSFFGKAFEQAADSTNSRTLHDQFDSFSKFTHLHNQFDSLSKFTQPVTQPVWLFQ